MRNSSTFALHFKDENLKNYAPTNIAYCASARLGVPLFFGANLFMEHLEYWKNLSLEPIRYYNPEGLLCVEEFRDIPNYEGFYQASNCGRIKSLNGKERILKLRKTYRGYLKATLYLNTKRKIFGVHCLVAQTFIPNPDSKKQVDHIWEIKTDNRVSELEWVTPRENATRHCLTKNRTSKYTGVWKKGNKWQSKIVVNKKSYHLGTFDTELDAHHAYQRALKEVNEGTFVEERKMRFVNSRTFINFSKSTNRWIVRITINGVRVSVGTFKTESEAIAARDLKIKEIEC